MNAPVAAPDLARPGRIRRGAATWSSYLLLGFFTYLLNIQGNIVPFLQAELGLSYRAVSLHASAIAAGMIAVGLLGDRVVRRLGRGPALQLAGWGTAVAAVLLCLAPAAWASIGACALIGTLGALIPAIVPAVLAETHGPGRDVALTEATAVAYAFGVTAPLAMSLCVALAWGWRAAVLLGAASGIAIVLAFRHARFPAPPRPAATASAGRLPARYWAYWCLLAMAVSIEYCALLWAPSFLERVTGLSPAAAAAAAAAFSAAMLAGRIAGSALLRRVAAPNLFLGALLVTLLGFLVYWGIERPLPAVLGLFVLGLGVAMLYPLTLGFAIEAAGAQGQAASARFMLAVGLAILCTPALLGALADRVGLRSALLVLPGLLLAALACFATARLLERRAAAALA